MTGVLGKRETGQVRDNLLSSLAADRISSDKSSGRCREVSGSSFGANSSKRGSIRHSGSHASLILDESSCSSSSDYCNGRSNLSVDGGSHGGAERHHHSASSDLGDEEEDEDDGDLEKKIRWFFQTIENEAGTTANLYP